MAEPASRIEAIARERGLSEDLKRRIFTAAMEVFAERGFERTKVEDVAKSAGMARATIYYHFRSKQDLFGFLLQEGIEEMAEAVGEAVSRAASPREALDAMVDSHIDFYVNYQSFARVVLAETWRMEPGNDFSPQRLLVHDLKIVSEVIADAKEAGVLKPELGEEFLASAFYGLLSAAAVHFSLVASTFDPSTLKRDVKELLFKGALCEQGRSSARR